MGGGGVRSGDDGGTTREEGGLGKNDVVRLARFRPGCPIRTLRRDLRGLHTVHVINNPLPTHNYVGQVYNF